MMLSDRSDIAALLPAAASAVAAIEATGERRLSPSGDGTMTWYLWGSGEPVVFLHGGMGSWMHWIRNIPALSRHVRMLVPNIPGHMDSAMPAEPYGPVPVASVLLRGIDEILGPSASFSIVGFSFGSAIGGNLARLGGKRVRKLILLSPGGLGLPRGTVEGIRRWRHVEDPAERLEIHRRNLQASMIADPARIDDLGLYIHAASTEVAKPVSAPISLSDTLQHALPGISAKLAGIWGENDPASAPFMAERRAFFRSIQPDASLALLPNASHWAQFEVPDAFNETVSALLGQPAPAEAGQV